VEWTSGERDILVAEHHAYERLPDPVVHRRTIDFLKGNRELRITDVLFGNAIHLLQFRLHFHPDVSLSSVNDETFIARSGAVHLRIELGAKAEIIDTLYSPSYGVLLQSKGLQIRIHAQLPHTLETRLTFVAE
jgi:hypothetical protein